MSSRVSRPLRLLAAAALVAALAATLGPTGPSSAAPAPAPTPAGQPVEPSGACLPGTGIEVTASMAEDLDAADAHRSLLPGSGSFGAGCEPNTESADGWPGRGIPSPPEVDPDAEDESDPFAWQGGLYLGYQFDRQSGGLPDYWEQPIAFRPENAELVATSVGGGLTYSMTTIGQDGESDRATVESTLPAGPECEWHGPVRATDMPGRVASYAAGGRQVYRYDHVPLRIGSRKFARATGGWFHYLCGGATPSGITGPAVGSRLSSVQADYYLTPHWVYAEGYTADQLTVLAPIVRAARARVNARVLTSPADRSVVGLNVWMWSDARRYEITLGGRQAVVEPTGIRVVAPGVPMDAHDLRKGGCAAGGTPDRGSGDTDCWFRFTKANTADPGDVYTVGFAQRWQVRVAGVARPLTLWTTQVQTYKVGEVQVVSGGG